MRITNVGDGYWDVEHEGKHFTVRRVGGDGPDYIIDERYWGHADSLMKRLNMSYSELYETMDNLIEGTNND